MRLFGLFIALLILAAAAAGTAHAADGAAVPADCAADPGGEPDDNTIGWVDGTWYTDSPPTNDRLEADDAEEAVTLSMARVESVRCLEYEETPDVEVWTREEFEEHVEPSEDELAEEKMERETFHAALLIDRNDGHPSELRVQSAQSEILAGAFYHAEKDAIVVIEENGIIEAGSTDFAQASMEALQHQHFDVPQEGEQIEDALRTSAVADGDVEHVTNLIRAQCLDDEWECFRYSIAEEELDQAEYIEPVRGLYLLDLFAHAEAASYVDSHADGTENWDAVNEMYDNPPATTSEVIHETTTREPGEGIEVSLNDTHDEDEWTRLRPEESDDYGVVGEAGLAAMFAHPVIDSGTDPAPVRSRAFFNADDWVVDPYDPADYVTRYTAGWEGDRVHAYENDAGEMAHVWRIEMGEEHQANEFKDGYTHLLEYWGGEEVTRGVYHVPGDDFTGTHLITVEETTVTVVSAPSPDDVDSVYGPAELNIDSLPSEEDDEHSDDVDDGSSDSLRSIIVLGLSITALGVAAMFARRFNLL